VADPDHLAELNKGIESWNQWRINQLVGPDLREANLEEAHLERANLRDAYLEGAHLERGHLEGANLREAYLERAHLKGANLEGANLEGANLEGANLESANLESANLEGVICGSTYWINLNLIEAIGLSALIHTAQSHLSTSTLALSKGRLPTEFLKGCGLADWEIESAKLYDPDLSDFELSEIPYRALELRMRGPIQISPVFISYSHADFTEPHPFARALRTFHRKRLGRIRGRQGLRIAQEAQA
jgi:hypothetical protein